MLDLEVVKSRMLTIVKCSCTNRGQAHVRMEMEVKIEKDTGIRLQRATGSHLKVLSGEISMIMHGQGERLDTRRLLRGLWQLRVRLMMSVN